MPAGDYYPIREFGGLSLAIMPRPRSGDLLVEEMGGGRAKGLTQLCRCSSPLKSLSLSSAQNRLFALVAVSSFFRFLFPIMAYPRRSRHLTHSSHRWSASAPGASIGVHCQAGIGRSGLTAACILVRAGIPYSLALARHIPSAGFEGS